GEQNARVISPDLPSHGGSALVKRFDYDEAAILVGAALSPVCPKPQAIVGASSGGIVALKLGARMKVSVVAIGAGASFSAKNVADMASQSRALPASTKSWHDRFADQGKPQTVALQKHLGDLAAIGTKPMFSPQEQQALASNVLLIHGRQDAFFAVENADLLARQITGSLFMTVNGADHLGPLGKPYSHFVWGIINGFVTRANSPQQ
ncbi:MAG TPA: alpha/beta hydrolase, partial [Sphingomicrobium sp.]|nr:alpha/beta hydrolase [Sphingomicrobium sp.]